MAKSRRACIVVLGDIGRSPRMQFHAISLVRQASLEVDIVAYGGSKPYEALLQNQSIHFYKMKQWPILRRGLLHLFMPLILLFKPLFQLLVLLWYLCVIIPAPDIFIVQNPPSVPTLIAVKLASWLRNSKFIIDWHNYGYTLLALSLGRNSLFVAVYCWLERSFGKTANGSLCVTKAMQHDLDQNWGIKASVLYDQPAEFICPSPEKTIEVLHSLGLRFKMKDDAYSFSCLDETLFTIKDERNNIFLKEGRPALVVSSTSWTADENFDILLQAAVIYDEHVASSSSSMAGSMRPRLFFLITGKGPEKENYERKIEELHLTHVAFLTAWLTAEEYPLHLGSADLGVCLHTSSSGLDLPMKVVDMFGCGLPVCAVAYSCIEELVKPGENGLLFSSSSELAQIFLRLFKGFPNHSEELLSLKTGALQKGSSRWASSWEDHAKPLILAVAAQNEL